ncbi:hypothetical protein BpHYR1_018125 [Brachionus plicatilis]|uniref:Atos-like conserved domain-containing protein n=1 Tax=Brachionus plicatilis TaxID=10195 RepID=A0A3M7RL40_BRAPC|nr:hypothetical protein BpHYR1_018125 [Brachionus plicatilis]
MQSLVVSREATLMNSNESGRSDLEDLAECLLNLIINSRVQSPLPVNSHSFHLLDLFMAKLYQLATEAKEYFPNQKFSSKKLPVHSCSDTNDQCRISSELSLVIEECLAFHLNKRFEKLGLKLSHEPVQFKHIETNILIDVLLLCKCCYQKIVSENSSPVLVNKRAPLACLSFELIERWQIKMSSENYSINQNELSKALTNINNLFQAIRSYLHFSQLSSWMNQSKSESNMQVFKNLAFSISYPTEINTEISANDIETENYDKQSFPLMNLNLVDNKLNISGAESIKKLSSSSWTTEVQTNLLSLKRNLIQSSGIPHYTCLINYLQLNGQITSPIPIDKPVKKPDLHLDKSPEDCKNSLVITTPTTFPNIPLYFDSNNNKISNVSFINSTSPNLLISSYQVLDEAVEAGSSGLGQKTADFLQINPVISCYNEERKKDESKKTKRISKKCGSFINFKKNRFNSLLGNFEECLLNGRLTPVGIVDGFYAELGASGLFFPEHKKLPVDASFYQVSDDIAASPYLGIIDLSDLGDRGYKIPNRGTIQVTLFNPNKTVVKMFVVMYDLSDMPGNHQTFLRQRTVYVPSGNLDDSKLKSYLRYLIHLRFSTSKTGKMYLHTNIKLIFARNKSEIDPRMGGRYEYKTFTEAPNCPKYSPKK